MHDNKKFKKVHTKIVHECSKQSREQNSYGNWWIDEGV